MGKKDNTRSINLTDILNEDEEQLVTQNELSVWYDTNNNNTTREYHICLANSKQKDLPLLSSLSQGAPLQSLTDHLPTKPGNYHIQDINGMKSSAIQMSTATITPLPDNYRFFVYLSLMVIVSTSRLMKEMKLEGCTLFPRMYARHPIQIILII